MINFFVRIKKRVINRFLNLLWFILPKKTEKFDENNVKYVIVPRFLINNAYGMVIYYRKSGRVIIFIRPHRYCRRYTIFHEYCEGKLFKEHRTEKQILRMALDTLHISSDIEIDAVEQEAKSLLEKLIAFVGEPEKAKELFTKASLEVRTILLRRLKDSFDRKGAEHILAVLQTAELAKKELSPEDFVSYLYDELRIEY